MEFKVDPWSQMKRKDKRKKSDFSSCSLTRKKMACMVVLCFHGTKETQHAFNEARSIVFNFFLLLAKQYPKYKPCEAIFLLNPP